MDIDTTVLALIPARSGSKGVPDKNVRLLAGKPLLAYACLCALGSRRVTRTIVSTDSQRYAELARLWGAEAPFLRPAELASDDCPTVEAVRHALDWLWNNDGWQPDVVVLLQPTSPLRTVEDVDQSLSLLLSSHADAVVSVSPVPSHFHPQWQFMLTDGQLRPYSLRDLHDLPARRQALSPTYTRNGAIYAFRRAALDETGSLYGRRCAALVMPPERSINIDTVADWHAVETLMQLPEVLREAS